MAVEGIVWLRNNRNLAAGLSIASLISLNVALALNWYAERSREALQPKQVESDDQTLSQQDGLPAQQDMSLLRRSSYK